MKPFLLSMTAAMLMAKEPDVHIQPWTLYEPVNLDDLAAKAPTDIRRTGFLVTVAVDPAITAVEIVFGFKRGGKVFRESKTVETMSIGCPSAGEPCATASVVFAIGEIDEFTAEATVMAWDTSGRTIPAGLRQSIQPKSNPNPKRTKTNQQPK